MAINYVCRHCRTLIGRIEATGVTEAQLGFHSLTPDERRDIIAYDSHGEMTVRVTCDYCREAIDHNPELLLLTNPLQ
ncbi:anti-sigma-F factor Fin family protein [Paenibacillus senegalimassiliensis]|uniref:anti-sigma-F factor Fin family protein n=1 Tax=Paenibacillus senegalimassiliensis TaxID=1737426 RepID=UPI00073E2624|nr:anti-sigma-F factor Fin family protein [Paenibacillus senegalimassiliensis]